MSLAGCSFVPKSRLDECHRLSQTLQTENDRLKDSTISLRSQNQDLNQRAVDDGRRLRVQEEEIQRLVQSVSAYQEERDQFTAAFDRIKRQIRTSVNPVSTDLLKRLEVLARAHPGWDLDPERGVLTIPAAQLFEPGSDRLRGEAEGWLRDTAGLWSAPEAHDLDLLIIGRNEASAVRRAALGPRDAASPGTRAGSAPADPEARPLGLSRAVRIRDLFTSTGPLNPARIEAVGFEVPQTAAQSDAAAQARNRRIEIHLRPRTTVVPDTASAAPLAPAPPAAQAAGRTDP